MAAKKVAGTINLNSSQVSIHMNENAIRVGDTVLDPTLLLLGMAGFAAFVLRVFPP